MDLSIVTTLYRSASTIEEFHRRASVSASEVADRYEIIYVNDGSPDDSLAQALRLREGDPHVRVVDLSRNFGHHYAITAGLAHASGDKVFLLDSDLEEDPEWLIPLNERLEADDLDVVFGVQAARCGGVFKKLTGAAFYRLFNALSETTIPANPCTARLMRREYVAALLTLRDRSLFLAGNCAWAGFRQGSIPVMKSASRRASTYNLPRMLALFVDAVTSFSAYPLRLIFFLGLSISVLSGIFGVALVIRKLLGPGSVLLGYASLMASLWFLSGLLIFCIGIIGVYLGSIFKEVKDRPIYIVRRVYGTPEEAAEVGGRSNGTLPAAS